ncbi:VOC family protein [Vibrio maerlii]|uniref:VOC family protein n=1 Tax=Vibrio maerlii TaxID=2231648 RepID=UPI0013DFFCC4|nr:VOC family protein [Vibrio maerlii]
MQDISEFSGHCGIQVSDIEESINFYLGLGFELQNRYQLPSGDGSNDKVAFLSLHGGLLELYQLSYDKACHDVGRINHFAIKVDDLSVIQERLKEKNIDILKGPKTLPFGANGMKFITIEGLDNERIEFNQFL